MRLNLPSDTQLQIVGLLVSQIREGIAEFPSYHKGNNGFGEIYECIMKIQGKDGKIANVLTSWIILNDVDFPKMTSAYVTKKNLR